MTNYKIFLGEGPGGPNGPNGPGEGPGGPNGPGNIIFEKINRD